MEQALRDLEEEEHKVAFKQASTDAEMMK